MRPIRVDEILEPRSYEKRRSEIRRRLIQARQLRRIRLGEFLVAIFENRESALGSFQELLRAERVEPGPGVAERLEIANAALPGEGEIAGALYLEVADPARMREELERFRSLDLESRLFLEFADGSRLPAHVEGRPSDPKAVPPVLPIRFRFTADEIDRLAAREVELSLVIDHPSRPARSVVPLPVRLALAEDLRDA
jgi:hypothetical protein